MKTLMRFLLVILLSNVPAVVFAHHSNAEYDRSTVTELEGEITRVIWRNPHVGLWVDVTDETGQSLIWRMEAADLLGTQRRGVESGTFSVGQQVKIAGYASTRRAAHMLVTNVLLPDDTEVLLTGNARARWSENILGGGNWAVAADVGSAYQRLGIFRVWTLDRTSRPSFSDSPPLTDSARQGWEQYDSYDDPALQCVRLGMPRVMTVTGPHPIAFVDRGAVILLQGEYFDVEREIHMTEDVIPASAPLSPLGYSIGRWQGDTLIVNTSRVNYPLFDISGLAGIPQSTAVAFEERFTLSEDKTQLHYDISISDPEMFTETVLAEDYAVWKWRPEIEIMPYQCEVD
ncbi:MAG: hypothetical protein HOH14_09385 [Gammaproteobacteria bacterium]|jgi:hypothetical protein|nr:hypothetical protein [Gammaproteobacteria bacterium]MBT6043693.1 hypothetical protein [Gammaproteobacteria bacterium]